MAITYRSIKGSPLTSTEIDANFAVVQEIQDNQFTSAVVYPTLAELPATGTLLVSYKVTNDGTSSNNGYYHWSGSAYVKDADTHLGIIEAGNVDGVSGGTVYETIRYKADLEAGKNKFNKDTTINGYEINPSTGNLDINVNYCYSDFIPVIPSTTYTTLSGNTYTAYYDSNRNFISGGAYYIKQFTTSASTYFVKISTRIVDKSVQQMEIGSVNTTYESYKLNVPLNQLENAVVETQLNDAITDSLKEVTEVSVNLFDETKATLDYLLNSGVSTTNAFGYSHSDYIPLVEGQEIVLSGYLEANVNLAFYDSDFKYISQLSQNTATLNPVTGVVNCAYIRFNFRTSHYGQNYIQAEYGTTRTTYKPYGRLLKDNVIYYGIGENLLNPSNIYAGTIYTSGLLGATSTTVNVSEMIAVGEFQTLFTNSVFNVTFYEYNSNMIFLRVGSTAVYNVNPYTTGVNCSYIRISAFPTILPDVSLRISDAPIDLDYVFPYTPSLNIPIKPSRVKEVLTQQSIEMPSTIWSADNEVETIYFKGLLRRYLPNEYFVTITNFTNYVLSAFKTITTDLTITTNLYDGEFLLKKKVNTNIVASDMALAVGSVIVNPIGDSITDINTQYKYCADNCPSSTFVGTYENTTTLLKHDGRSGWTLKQYFELIYSPSTYAGFSPFLHPTDLTLNYLGCTKFWIEAYNAVIYSRNMKWKGDELGGFNSTTGYRITPVLNDVMYVYANSRFEKWNGSAWVDAGLTSVNFVFNYAKYLSVWNITEPTFVTSMLGTNDYGGVSHLTATATTNVNFIAWYDEMIASIHAVNSLINIAIVIPPFSSPKSNTSGNFGAYKNASLFELRKMIIENYDNRSGENIYVVDCGTALDIDNDFTENVDGIVTDATHPNTTGFESMGKRLSAFIQAIR
jgi:lysophospholipase L1-like esterase